MIQTVAVSYEDGWAYVRLDQRLYLIYPPYSSVGLTPADERTVERAIGTLGFSFLEREFRGWQELVSFLHDRVVEARRERGRDVAESAPGREFLRVAPAEELRNFLNRVESELIPQQKLEHAENLLLAMLTTPEVQDHRDITKRAAELMQRVHDHRGQVEDEKRRLAGDSTDPPGPNGQCDAKEVAQYAEKVAKCGPFALALR